MLVANLQTLPASDEPLDDGVGDGAEFVHRILWENRIEHEYRLLHDCDYVGNSLTWRMQEVHRWLGRMARALLRPQSSVPPEPTAAQSS